MNDFAPLLQALAVLAVIATVLLILTMKMLRQKRDRFRNREDLPAHELYLEFFSDSELDEEAVTDFLRLVSTECEVPMGKLRPDDRFLVELAPTRGWELDDGVWLLPDCLAKRFGGAPSDYRIENPQTIRSISTTIAHRRRGDNRRVR